MRIIHRPQTDPYFNLAAEEYLLKSMDTDCFMLWRNEASVIVGKHQNSMAEINHRWVMENQVPVIRRISGGGTVFHDPGNLNFSFITLGNPEKLVDFKKFMKPIIEVLNNLGLPARYEGKNDIRVNGLKISGNAEHVYRNRILHHGTLLFNARLNRLNEAIKVNTLSFHDKAVKSVRSKVANIADLLESDLSLDNFAALIIEHIEKQFPNFEHYHLSEADTNEIQKLADEKYKTWDWNFAYSPDYEFMNTFNEGPDTFQVKAKIKKGLLDNFVLKKNEKIHPSGHDIASLLVGKKHNFAEVDALLKLHETTIDFELRTLITKILF